MKKNLYDIVLEYEELINEIEDNDGVIDDDIADKLQISESELENKLRSYLNVIKRNEDFQDYNKKEIKRLRDRNKSFDNLKDRLSKYILPAIKSFGTETKAGNYSIKFADFSVSTNKGISSKFNPDKVNCLLRSQIKPDLNNPDHIKALEIINGCKNVLNEIGSLEITLSIPFEQLVAYRKELADESVNSAVWNITKTDVKKAIEIRDELQEELENNSISDNDFEIYTELNDFLNYIEAETETKESIIFK